jgi:integrase
MARKLGQIIAVRGNTWMVRIPLGRDPQTQKRNYYDRTIHGSFRQAQTFLPILNRVGLPDIRLYDLRHTAATLALTVGVSPKVVSEQLGHSSAAFTLDVYSHVLPRMQDDAAAKVESALMGASA